MALEQILRGSFFSIESPVRLFDRWVNPCIHECSVRMDDKELLIKWNRRAAEALSNNLEPLVIEMQLYFSCVVKKRVIFHNRANFKTRVVNDSLQIAFRAIEAARCDPQEFARNYPLGRVLDSSAAAKMIPSWLAIDYRQGQWQGEFGYKL